MLYAFCYNAGQNAEYNALLHLLLYSPDVASSCLPLSQVLFYVEKQAAGDGRYSK